MTSSSDVVQTTSASEVGPDETGAKSGRTKAVIDAMNVIGSRPDGWWKDRRGAMLRLAASLRALPDEVCVVFDGRPWEGAPQDGGRLTVRWAPVADEEIVRLVTEHPDPGSLSVVTSDAELAGRVRSLGAAVEPAGAFRRRLDAASACTT